MDDFSIRSFSNYFNIDPSPANKILPGKRPQSSMSPIVAYDRNTGDVRLAIAAEGGVKIISSVSQVAMRVLYLNQTLEDALNEPRIHNQLLPYFTFYEAGFNQNYLDDLKNIYHQPINPNISSFGSFVCGIRRTGDGHLEAAMDVRKGGGNPSGF